METNPTERSCGLDLHRDTVVACLLVPGPGRKLQKLMRTFATYTLELLQLRAWLLDHGVTHVGMESTGCYLDVGLHRAGSRTQLDADRGQCTAHQKRAGP